MSTERPQWIGVSTKMYLGYQRSLDWMTAIAGSIEERNGALDGRITPFVIPSYPVLESALRLLAPAGGTVGAQDVSEGEGALTGEVSAELLAEMGVRLVEIGHAERRRLFGETEDVVARKTAAALGAGLTPLLCVGEASEGDAAAAIDTVVEQCTSAVDGDDARLGDLVVAYEPVWAIGAPEPASADYVNEVVSGIRRRLAERADRVPPIIYGGSAGPGLLARVPEVDGLFLGRFAHDPANFARVLDEAIERS